MKAPASWPNSSLAMTPGQGGTVDGHQETIAPRAELVDGPGDQFLAGARFAEDQHGAVGAGDLLMAAHTAFIAWLSPGRSERRSRSALAFVAQVTNLAAECFCALKASFKRGNAGIFFAGGIADKLAQSFHPTSGRSASSS